jgi:hypothetical protein
LPVTAVGKDAVLQVVEDACHSAEQQYDDYYKAFIGLDGKAQSAGTVAGVVMGAVVAFVNAPRLDAFLCSHKSLAGRLLILAPAGLALITVIMALSVLWVRNTAVPHAAGEQMDEAEELANLPDDEVSTEQVVRYFRGRFTHLREALKDIDAAVSAKGWRLLAAQIALAATLVSLLLLFFKIVSSV